ncbi:Mitochondrial import inner membrane translocase subunit Tim10B [Lucilia cuprina]|uniref:Mitochondrial import inner membrane translocase subunit n=1 Tax=Lucilia cuprina TaxID=7375 RepID=A0A0L0C7C8_LUCCU|nr:mitochondrial import inner membrane translocase subunit Tim10B [Lucilia cuprina]KAI8129359.1 Mitochondrial import inner membrane translocase subunit Tim10B [Lucilia cuprina]KNC28157.1 Mitochondrial import inner membrane translocase subunit Tim10B [Lucilia cuprina]
MDPNLRNLKDFLTLYNKVTELCFTRCIDTFNERDLAEHENICVNRCVNKFAQFNQSMMKVYVEVQTSINTKRMQELEQQQQQQQEQSSPNTTAASTAFSSSSTASNLPA